MSNIILGRDHVSGFKRINLDINPYGNIGVCSCCVDINTKIKVNNI